MPITGFWSGKTPAEKIAAGYTASGVDPCTQCGLSKDVISPQMPVSGEGRMGILAIGEGPGKNEDEQGIQFVGEAGQLWQSYLDPHGISIPQDLFLDKSVQCRPPGNRTPTSQVIAH